MTAMTAQDRAATVAYREALRNDPTATAAEIAEVESALSTGFLPF